MGISTLQLIAIPASAEGHIVDNVTGEYVEELWNKKIFAFNGSTYDDGRADASLLNSAALAEALLDFGTIEGSPEGVLLQNSLTGELYLYTQGSSIGLDAFEDLYTGFDDLDALQSHRRANNLDSDGDLWVLQFRPDSHSFFYNNMPDIYHRLTSSNSSSTETKSEVIFELDRTAESNQAKLTAALAAFRNSSLAQNPLVQLGLDGVKQYVLLEDKETNIPIGGANTVKRSPSQFDNQRDIVYINANDLKDCGYVVLLHELLQAGLKYVQVSGHASASDLYQLDSLARNKGHFFDGYMNAGVIDLSVQQRRGYTVPTYFLEDLQPLSTYKAFAIGYTYKLLKQHYNQLPAKEQANAALYFSDVEYNRAISDIRSDIVIGNQIFVRNEQKFTIFGGYATRSEIQDFLDDFSSPSKIKDEVDSIVEKAHAGVNHVTYKKVAAAVNLAVMM